MSPEQEELQELARAERAIAWQSIQRLPGRTGDTIAAFVRQHPVLTMGGAAAVAMGVAARKHKQNASSQRSTETDGEDEPHKKGFSLPMALAAVGTQMLPELLKLAGLTAREQLEDDDEDEPLADKPAGVSPNDGRVADERTRATSGADKPWQPREQPDLVNVRA